MKTEHPQAALGWVNPVYILAILVIDFLPELAVILCLAVGSATPDSCKLVVNGVFLAKRSLFCLRPHVCAGACCRICNDGGIHHPGSDPSALSAQALKITAQLSSC